MLEAACVVAIDGSVIYWHMPAGRSSGALPDSRSLWEVLWSERARLDAVAHTQPGRGSPEPSQEDLTTFAAVEAALGRRLRWWIATADRMAVFQWCGPDRFSYRGSDPPHGAAWLDELRQRSTRGVP